MVQTFDLFRSDKKDKKFVIFDRDNNYKRIDFGAKGMDDYTLTENDEQKERYLKRHKKNENWKDKDSAGFFSRFLLWNKKTLAASIKDTQERFNIKIINHTR